MGDDLNRIKAEYTIFAAWHDLRLPGSPGANCRSPFREDDKHPSFSIFDNGRAWKDHGTDEGGTVVDFVMTARDCDTAEAIAWLMEKHGILQLTGESGRAKSRTAGHKQPSGLTIAELLKAAVEGDGRTWRKFAEMRGLTCGGVQVMARGGFLRFGRVPWSGKPVPSFIVTDRSQRAAEVRRWDGGMFGNHKAYPLAGVKKSCPLGWQHVVEGDDEQAVLMTEGATDFLTAIDLYCRYRKGGGGASWLPLGVLGASVKTLDESLAAALHRHPLRIVPDADEAGRKMAEHWRGLFPHAKVLRLPQGTDLTDNRNEINVNELFQ